MRHTLTAVALSAALALPIAASAAVVEISNITAAWSSITPPGLSPAPTITNNNTAAPSVRWGTPVGATGQSGYDFVGTPGTISTTLPPSPTPAFVLGDFTHLNQPIASGTSITGLVLTITANIAIDSVAQGSRSFVFNVLHDETPNGADPCAYGGANNQGVNINGCADRVLFNYNNLSETFTIGTDVYTLNVTGFSVAGVPVTEFLTPEGLNSTAQLLGTVALRSDVEVRVPVPGALVLFGSALIGLGFALRRRSA